MTGTAVPQSISYEEAPFSPIHKKIMAGAFMGQICDGYTLGIVGIALSYASGPLGLTSFWLGLIGAGALLGILFGSLLVGSLADRIGRKSLFATVIFASVILSVAQFFISDPLLLAVARLALGMTIGADYTVGISLLSEWTPKRLRPRMLSWLLVCWTLGYVLSYIAGVLMMDFLGAAGENGWRWVLCTSAIPGAITLTLRIGIPESPSWLSGKGRTREALELVQRYLGEKFGLPPAEAKAPSASWFRLFSKELRYNTLVSGVFFAAQVLPFFAISIFLPLVLADLKIDNPHASGIMYNVFTISGVLIGTWLIDRISRRAFLLWTFYGAAAILLVMTLWQDMPGYLAMPMLGAFSLVLAISIILEFSYPPELFPTELRASGVGLTVAISRIGAAGGTFLLPIVNENFGVFASLGGCIATLLLGGIVCHIWAPETSERFRRGGYAKASGTPAAVGRD